MAAHDHGHTPAAWTAVLIILAGIFVGAFAVSVLNWTLFWIGIGVIVLGLVVGKIMQMMGMGKAADADEAPAEPDRVEADPVEADPATAERNG